jgi:alanyl-tRNA synthetase
MTDEEIKQVEKIVNEKIREDILNNTYENVPIEEAKNMGAMALFGEKYGDHVRVVAFDKEYSVELCGGTHIASTGRIGSFKILSEGAIAAGVRRIEAVTGDDVMCYLDNQLEQIAKIKEIVKTSGDLIKAIENLSAQNQMLQKKVEQMMQEKAVAEARNIYNTAVDFEGRKLVIARVEADVNQMRTIATSVKELDAEAILLMGGIFEGKPALCVMIPQSLVDERKWDAGAMIREAAKEIQGGGGGQKTLATAGGKNVDGIDKAMEILKSKINN